MLDPTGNIVELLGDEKERENEIALLRKSVGNDKAAAQIGIKTVKDGDTTHYLVDIKGDMGKFIKLSYSAHDLGNLVANKETVKFSLTSQNLANLGGAVTYEKGEKGNQNVRVLFNPAQIHFAEEHLNPNTLLGSTFWSNGAVNPFTPGAALWHEFGHACGFINGRTGSATGLVNLP